MFLEIKNLFFNYFKEPIVLNNINFSVNKNEKLIFLAVHEMGNSTLANIISGYEDNYIGNILLEGKNFKQILDEDKHVSLLPSNPVFLENKSIKQNIRFLFDCTKKEMISDDEIINLLGKFEIQKPLSAKVKKLSIFEKRKFAFLRSYLKKPQILVIDDQFYGLNAEECEKMQKIYNLFLNEKDLTVFCFIQDKSFILGKEYFLNLKFDRVFYLNRASLFEFKTIKEMINSKRDREALNFLDDYDVRLAYIERRADGYFVILENDMNLKLDEKKINRNNLKIEVSEEENVELISFEKLDILNLNQNEFNKCLNEGKLLIFSSLDGSRIV